MQTSEPLTAADMRAICQADAAFVRGDDSTSTGLTGVGTVGSMSVPTRVRILDAAWELFLRQGFVGTTVTQIEAAAQLSPGSGSFYRHFQSKQDVLRAVVDREVERIDAARELGPEPYETGGDVRIALTLELRRRLDNLRRLQPLMMLIGREREHLGASNDNLGDLLVDHNLEVRSQRLEGWMEAGAIPERDADALAAVVLCALTGYHLSQAFFGRPPGGLAAEAIITTLVELVVGGVPPAASTSRGRRRKRHDHGTSR